MLLFLLIVLCIIWFSLMGYVVYKYIQVKELDNKYIQTAYDMREERLNRTGPPKQ